MKRITFTVSDSLHKRVKKKALQHDLTIKEYATRLLEVEMQNVSEHKKKRKGVK